jgi:hypothetical protein
VNDGIVDDLGPGDEIVAEEWPTYYTQVPVWILLAGTSAQAYRMYAFLAEHINHRQPGRRIACPSTKAIARVLGLRDYRKVKPYRVELEQIGAIRVQEVRYAGGMRRSYRYFVRFNPPTDHQGPVALAQFYELNPDVRSRPVEGRVRAALAVDSGRDSKENTSTKTTSSEVSPPLALAKQHRTSGADFRPLSGAAGTHPLDASRRPPGQRLTANQWQVYMSFPAPLQQAMHTSTGGRVPKTLVAEITRQLRNRNAQQLCERVTRRWETHRYRALLEAGQLSRPVGAAVAMLRHGECPDPMCEDGVVLDTGTDCRSCIERRKDQRVARKSRRTGSKRGQETVHAEGGTRCSACDGPLDVRGDVCAACRSRLERHVTDAADRAAEHVRASVSGAVGAERIDQESERVRLLVLKAAESGGNDARDMGASDLGVLIAAQWAGDLAASTAARE